MSTRLLLFFALLLALAGCGAPASPAAQIIGHWDGTNGISLEFFPNGVVIQTNPSGHKFAGTYTLSADGKTLTSESNGSTVDSPVTLSGDSLQVFGVQMQRGKAQPTDKRPVAELLVGAWSGEGGRYTFAADGSWAYYLSEPQPVKSGRYTISADSKSLTITSQQYGDEQLPITLVTASTLVLRPVFVFERAADAAGDAAPAAHASALVASPAAPAPSPASGTSIGGDTPPDEVIESLYCSPIAHCNVVLIERSPKKYPNVGDIWCAITDSPEAPHQGVSLHKDANLGIWARTTAFPKDFRELECEQSALAMESAAATAVALATPTKEPLRATKVIGVPLLPGTLELDGCTPEANCVALVTETPPGKDYLWCAVLERDGELVPGIFLKMTETAATGQSATVEDMRRQGCTVAPAMLDGRQPDSAADARAATATLPADEIPAGDPLIGDPPIDDSALDPAVSADLIGIPFRASASASAPAGVNACNQRVSYDPTLVQDGQLDTAWRVPGDGKGQFLRLDLAAPTLISELSLVPGYAKVDPCDGVNRFTQNRRVRKVRLSFSDGSSVEGSFTDAPTLQPVHFAPVRASWVQISILETYPQPAGAAGRDFTPISEVVISGSVP